MRCCLLGFIQLFPLVSVDQIALPDFNAGAMENWGLVTYRETALLYDSKLSSVGNKERVATVIAHELAHMVCHSFLHKHFTNISEVLSSSSTEGFTIKYASSFFNWLSG